MHHHKLLSALPLLFLLNSASQAQEPLFPQLDSESANAIGGNWKVHLKKGNGVTVYEGHLVMTPPVKTGEVVLKNGTKRSLLVTDPDGEWKSDYLNDNEFDRDIKIAGKRMKFAHSHGIGGHWGAVSLLDFSGDTGHGKWNYSAEHLGTETWTRLRPTVTKVEFGPLKAGEEGSLDKAPVSTVAYGRSATVPSVYDDKSWGPGNNFPHARPKFYIRVYGENLWGFHMASIPNAAGFDVIPSSPIYAEGKSGFENQIGKTYVIALWPGVTNGSHTFRLDDLEIPFQLKVRGLKPMNPKKES